MTTDVEHSPLTGSPGLLHELAGAFARAATALTETCTGLSRLDGALSAHRTATVDDARALLDTLRSEATLARDVLAGAATALATRADELAVEQADARLAIARRDAAQERLARAEEDEAAAWRICADPTDPRQPEALQQIWWARRRAEDATGELAAAEADWRRARDAKHEGSRRAVPALVGLAAVRVVRLTAAAGTDLASVGASWARGTSVAELARAVPTAGQDVDATRAELRRALVTAGDDPAFWSAFWGAATPADLYLAIGEEPDPALAEALRTGTETWAAAAAPAELQAFGRAVVDDLGADTFGLGDRSRLAAALLTVSLPAAVHTGAAAAWTDRRDERGPDDLELLAAAPVSAAVADGLAADPAAALDFFSPTDQAELARRVDAWFAQTPLDRLPDGGASIAGLLAAAVTNGTRHPSSVRQGQAALLASHATPALVSGHGLLAHPEHVSAEASRHVARAYAPYFVSFETFGDDYEPGVPPDPAVAGRPPLAEGVADRSDVVQPVLDALTLRLVIGATSQDPVAAEHWLGSVDAYLDDATRTATEPGRSPLHRERISNAAIRDGVFVAASIESPTILDAVAERDAAAQAYGWFSTASSVGTVAAPLAVAAPATAANIAAGQLLPDEVDEARAEVLANEPALRARMGTRTQDGLREGMAAQGASDLEIADAIAPFAPGSDSLDTQFGDDFSTVSGLGRHMGENT